MNTNLPLRDNTVITKILPYLNGGVLIFIGIFIFLNPFPHTTAIEEISFYVSVFITLLLILSRSCDFSWKNPLSVFLLLYVCWSVLSIFWSIDKGNSSHDVYAHLVKHIILYFLLINFFCSRKRLVILMWLIVISTAIFSIGGIIYFYFVLGEPFSARLLCIPNAPGTPVNTIAIITMFAAIISLFLLLKEENMLSRFIMLICFIGTSLFTLLTYSRGALIALIVSFFVMLFILYRGQRKKLLALIVVLFIAIGSFTAGSPILMRRVQLPALLDDARLNIWYTSLEMIKDSPLAGKGFGMESFRNKWWDHYNSKVPVRWKCNRTFYHPHSFIINVTVRLGLIGLILVVLILFFSFRISIAALRSNDDLIRNLGACFTAALVGVLVAGLFGKLASGPSAVIFYTLLSMITVLWRLNLEEEQVPESESEYSVGK